MLHIIVCMKIVIDPEMPFSDFRVDRGERRPIPPPGTPPVFSPFDENALEVALRIKNRHKSDVTVLSVGKSLPKAVLQKALAAGADRVVAVEGAVFADLDSFNATIVLSQAIRRIGTFDLVFTGRQGADWDAGLTSAGVAASLGIPFISLARNTDVQDGRIVVERCVSDGIEFIEALMPALVSYSNEAGELRDVTLPALLKAKKQEITKWSATELGFEKTSIVRLVDLFSPDLAAIDHYLVSGETLEEKGRNLAKWFSDEGLLEPNV